MKNKNTIKIELRKPTSDDREVLSDFFNIIIPHTFVKEGLAPDHEYALEEIVHKNEQLKKYLETDDGGYYLVATMEDKIVGTIWYGKTGDLICVGSKGALSDHGEIGTVFVHPKYQEIGRASCRERVCRYV